MPSATFYAQNGGERCLQTKRWFGSVVLVIVDAAFTSIGLNYISTSGGKDRVVLPFNFKEHFLLDLPNFLGKKSSRRGLKRLVSFSR